MDDSHTYSGLPPEDTWIDYLRTRLPYSFRQVRELSNPKRYELSDPTLVEAGITSSKYHNFWTRGNAAYAVGKIADYYKLSSAGEAITKLMPACDESAIILLQETPAKGLSLPTEFDVWDIVQVAKMWEPVKSTNLERERVAMHNVLFGVELCLKAIMAHARYREAGSFTFDPTHDVSQLYRGLPTSLQDELAEESVVFADSYMAYHEESGEFLKQLSKDLTDLRLKYFNDRWKPGSGRLWHRIFERVRDSRYTAYMSNPEVVPDRGWLHRALEYLSSVRGMDTGTYFRYAPFEDADELPVEALRHVLLLGRFLYEHLFPVVLTALLPGSRLNVDKP
ncbi:MAG: hypothetical protein F4Y94_03630 [Chloroflexi bacterium]|nr:hypothetical protein [Chloroflexota bacterium]